MAAIQKPPYDEFKVKDFHFTWKIKSFSLYSYEDEDTYITSPVFQVELIDIADWELRLFPKWEEQFMKLEVVRKKNYKGPTSDILVKAFLVEQKREYDIPADCMMTSALKYETNSVSLQYFHANAESFLPDDVLTVRCHLTNPGTTSSGTKYCTGYTDVPTQNYTITLPVFISLPLDSEDHKQNVTIPMMPITETQPKYKIVLKVSRGDITADLIVSESNARFLGKCKVLFQDISCHKKELFSGKRWYEESPEDQVGNLKKVSERIVETPWTTGFYEIVCELFISSMKETSYVKTTSFKPSTLKFMLENISFNSANSERRENLKNLYMFGKLCNLTLHTQGQTFPVHKSVLANASDYFRRIFDKNAPMDDTTAASIEDVDPETLRRTIDFIYCEIIEDLQMGSAIKLYDAAHKYQIPKLKERCAIFIKAALCFENVCDVLAYGYRYQNTFLFNTGMDFLRKTPREIFESEIWKKFTEENLGIAAHIMHQFLLKVSSNLY